MTERSFKVSAWTEDRRDVAGLAMLAIREFPHLDVVRFMRPKECAARESALSRPIAPDSSSLYLPEPCTVSRERFVVRGDLGPRTWRVTARIYDADNDDTFFVTDDGFVFVEDCDGTR